MDLNYNTMDLGYQFSQKIREVVEVPAGSKSTLGVAFLALRGFPPFEVCKKGLVFAL
jgi:hypothetical protein